jgi:hypothetical protein
VRRTLLSLLALLLPFGVSAASAAPPVDPPLTYRLTVYGNDGKLAPDAYVIVRGTGKDSFLPNPSCAEAKVKDGKADLVVNITDACPSGMRMSLSLWLPEGPIRAFSESGFEWRKAYSETTTSVELGVRPVSLRVGPNEPGPLYVPEELVPSFVVCPPNRPGFSEAQTVSFRNARFDLPAGEYRWLESPPGSGSVVVCHGPGAGVRFSVLTCMEQGRRATTNDEQWIFDAIVASCRRIA